MLNATVKHLSIGILILSPSVLLACYSALSYQHSADQREAVNKPTTQLSSNTKSIEVALIVVDTTRPDWNRYGIVIISERPKKLQKVEIKWLFRDRDLSRVQLDWSSGDTLGIAEYGDDGLRRHCFVKWDAKKRVSLRPQAGQVSQGPARLESLLFVNCRIL